MKYFKRHVSTAIDRAVKTFVVLAVIGPRQSGKTTLLKKAAAETQMEETGYARRFADRKKPVNLMPVVFEYSGRNAVIHWEEVQAS